MRFVLLSLVFLGCNTDPNFKTLQEENKKLRKELDSLKNELHECDMMLKSYEDDPLTI